MERMEIEKEYDERYEGFDYDDVDDGVQKKYWAEAEGEGGDGGDADLPGHNHPAKARRVPSKITAEDVLQMHDKIAKLLISIPHRDRNNHHAIASRMVLTAAPLGSSKPVALSKLANRYRKLTKILSTDITKLDEFLNQIDDQIIKSDGMLSRHLMHLDRELRSPQGSEHSSEERIAGILLQLSSLHVSAAQLGKNADACRRIRKLRKDGRTLVARASVIVTEAWRATVLARDDIT
jgi:hypothetical protein